MPIFFFFGKLHLVSGLPCIQYIPLISDWKLTTIVHNGHLSLAWISCLMCSFSCPSMWGFFTFSLAFMCSQRKVVRSKEVRSSGWPGDVTKTWTEVSRKIDSQTMYWSMCCVCYDSFLVEKSASSSVSVSHVSSIVRLQSLYICLFDMPGKSTCDVICNK